MKNKKSLVSLCASLLVACSSLFLVSCNKDTPTNASAKTVEYQVRDKHLLSYQGQFKGSDGKFLYEVVSVEKTDGRYDEDQKIYIAEVTYKLKMNVSTQNIKTTLDNCWNTNSVTPESSFLYVSNGLKPLFNILNTDFIPLTYDNLPNFNNGDTITIKKRFAFSKYDSGWRMLEVKVTH